MNKLLTSMMMGVMVLFLILGCNHEGDNESASTPAPTETASEPEPTPTQAPTQAPTPPQEENTTTSTETEESTASETETVDPQVLIDQGMALAQGTGCTACHSLDGAQGVGPTWLGLYGSTRPLTDGTEVIADDEYIKESILNPTAKVVEGFTPSMPAYQWDDEQIQAIIAYIESLTE